MGSLADNQTVLRAIVAWGDGTTTEIAGRTGFGIAKTRRILRDLAILNLTRSYDLQNLKLWAATDAGKREAERGRS